MYKLIAGLNSQTFNYLQNQSVMDKLQIKDHISKPSIVTMTPVDFYSTYVSRSKPALLASLAKTWPAFELWQYEEGGTEYLTSILGDTNVGVFIDVDPKKELNDDDLYQGFSFDADSTKSLPYQRVFLNEMSDTAVGVAMRDSSLDSFLGKDVIRPLFYD